jgi:hypothetical protein
MSRNGMAIIYDFIYLNNISTKLATRWKLCGVSTDLPNLEVLCLKHVWVATQPLT